ncbi:MULTISPECIES: ABC transporter substrate-binding protein [Fibrobacter]|uniref:ABC transporter substrate-binding protein n=1 Tax=Fibrobacter TaxID=832 RepID=UPI000BB128CD|nr:MULTISPECIES: ABC transporter substrate-binding protein [Fibrobacter]MDD7300059.1 ABC transporter substrate-binding protein [Fibrobacter intestinalis]PBC69370.1 peptide/nickel transport system substrate-binding protein [Fibrobacter sp. UWS1]
MNCLKTIAKGTVALSACFGILVGCGGPDSTDAASDTLPRKETLYLSGQQWGTPNSFNPLAESWNAAWPVGGRFNLMYEPLITYNTLNGRMESLLGTLVEELSNNDSVVVDLNPKAKWSDGVPVSAKDVKFIFELGHHYSGVAINTSEQITGVNVQVVATVDSASGDTLSKVERLSFMINKNGRNNPLSVRDLLQAIRIVPEHIFGKLIAEKGNSVEEVKKLMLDKNPADGKEPVISGPYNLSGYSTTKIILKRRDDYWGNEALHNGKLPAPKFIVHPIYKSNEHSTIALRDGDLDASMSFVPRIWRKAGADVHAWFDKPPYFAPGAMPMMMINTLRKPLDNKYFRRAIATAIDYAAIRQFAVSNYTSELEPGLIMPTNLEGKYVNKEDCDQYGVKLNLTGQERIDSTQALLKLAGVKSVFNESGVLDHMEYENGERIKTIFITSPNGWTDWEAMVTIAVESLRKAGLDIREGFVDGGQYWPAMGQGNFDLVMHKPTADVTPSLPWSRFNEVMSSRDWAPLGSWAGTNIGRYNQPGTPNFRPEVDSLLTLIPLMTDSVAIASAYRTLNRIFMEDQVSIPLAYLPEQYYEYSDRVWTNWPNANNPQGLPQQLPWIAYGTNILWNLQLQK